MIAEYLILKPMTSLEKCFPDEDLSARPSTDSFVMFANERLSFQVGVYNTHKSLERSPQMEVRLGGDLAKYAAAKQVTSVPVQYPTSHVGFDTDMLRERPCLCPDPIRPLHYEGKLPLPPELTQTLWIDVVLPEGFAAGTYSLTVGLYTETESAETSVTVRVIGEVLPKQKLIHTEWFYTDCIAEVYHAKVFSERHWKLIERYLRIAVANGINMILTPIFTLELDTAMYHYRMTTQLADITVTGKNEYSFDLSKLDRWIDLCRKCGVEYYEIPHFFSQWGPFRAPKIVAKVNGKNKRIFGWETEALGEEYRAFLTQFIPAVVECFKRNGVYDRTIFHISDEPADVHIPQYKKCRDFISPLIGDRPIIDALSHFEFYEQGILKKPVPAIKSIAPFLEHKVPGLWAYYCGNPPKQTGRCITMPGYRTRILGVQLWKYNIEGFLHWGFDFYHNIYSYEVVDPLGDTGGEFFAPSGDAFVVYPGIDDTPWGSIRLNALREAVDDMRALDCLAEKKGRDTAEKVLAEAAGMDLTFTEYPRDNAFFGRLREMIAKALAE